MVELRVDFPNQEAAMKFLRLRWAMIGVHLKSFVLMQYAVVAYDSSDERNIEEVMNMLSEHGTVTCQP